MSFYFDHLSQAYELLRGVDAITTHEALPGWFLEATGIEIGSGPELMFGIDHVRLGESTLPVTAVPEGEREADYPLGAFVTPQRYEAVLLERLQWPESQIVSWTTMKGGPSEFGRLLEVAGSYTVVMVEASKRTVGLYLGEPSMGARVRPRLVRLMRAGHDWRHGVAFVPISQ